MDLHHSVCDHVESCGGHVTCACVSGDCHVMCDCEACQTIR